MFVDIKKTYDNVNKELLRILLKRIGIPPKLVKAIAALHNMMRAWRMGWDRLPKQVLFGVMEQSTGQTGLYKVRVCDNRRNFYDRED